MEMLLVDPGNGLSPGWSCILEGMKTFVLPSQEDLSLSLYCCLLTFLFHLTYPQLPLLVLCFWYCFYVFLLNGLKAFKYWFFYYCSNVFMRVTLETLIGWKGGIKKF